MTTRAHKFILEQILRLMMQKGYRLVSIDDNIEHLAYLKSISMPKIKRHKPDLLGIHPESDRICIGEAKTRGDLTSQRTKEQIEDLSSLIYELKESVELIFGVPSSESAALRKLLKESRVLGNEKVTVLSIPDEVLPNDS